MGATLHNYRCGVALSVVIDRARSYLLRARGHKQQGEYHKRLASGKAKSYHVGRMRTHFFFARMMRHHARLALQEAQRMYQDRVSYGSHTPPVGARMLNGADFRNWPQYTIEMSQFRGDLWERRNNAG